MKNGDSTVGKVIVLLFYLLLFWFFYFFPLITEVLAEGVEDVEVVEVVEDDEVVETIEHVVTIQQEDPEPVDLGRPVKHFMGVPSVVSDRIVDEFSFYAPFWFDSIASGEMDYLLYYHYDFNQYVFLVLDKSYFEGNDTFFYFQRYDPVAVGIYGILQADIFNQNPFTIRFDGDTGDYVSESEPGEWVESNLTWIPDGWLVGTSLDFGINPLLPNTDVNMPVVGESGYNWLPVLERSIVLREGVEIYETERYALFLFIAVGYVIVDAFRFGYFSRNY